MPDFDAQPGREPPEQTDLSTAQLEADEDDLRAGLRGLAGMVAGARGVFELLSEVAAFAAEAIPGVDGAGVALIEASKDLPTLQSTAATAGFVHRIDAVQYDELHEGPCITCMQSRRATGQWIPRRRRPLAALRWPSRKDGRAFRAVAAADSRRACDRRDQLLCR